MMVNNQFTTSPFTPPQWEETEDGFLRVTARVLAERVMPYAVQELENVPEGIQLTDAGVINMLVTCESMATADSLRTLEGAQIVAPEHIWVTPDNVGVSKGNAAGSARIDGPYLVIDLLVTDPATIDAIKNREIGEISAGYHADTIFEQGEWDGLAYQAKQCQLRFNHIAIIPFGEGRAGSDVRILNKKINSTGGKKPMADVRVRLRNTGKIINTDDEGAAALAEEESSASASEESSGKKLEESMSELEVKNQELAQLQAEIEELKGELSVYKEKLDEILSDSTIERAAEEMTAEQGEAEEIIENTLPEEEKEKVKNSLKGLHGSKLHQEVLTVCGVRCENMSPESLRGAFKAQHQIISNAKAKGVAGARFINAMSQKSTTVNPAAVSTRTPMERLGLTK